MFGHFIFLLICLGIIYAYTNHTSQFEATASAIRQIWSGSCRLSCRHSEYSGFSGLSGLAPDLQGQTSAGPSSDCVCESCPCALIENVLRSCSPATNLYMQSVEFLSNCYYDIIKMFLELYGFVERALTGGPTFQRQAEMITVKHFDSTANVSFGERNFTVKEQRKERKSILNLMPSKSAAEKRKSEVLKNNEINNTNNKFELPSSTRTTPQSIALNVTVSETGIKSLEGSTGSDTKRSSCSKCIEKGVTCMVHCPRAKKNNETKKNK